MQRSCSNCNTPGCTAANNHTKRGGTQHEKSIIYRSVNLYGSSTVRMLSRSGKRHGFADNCFRGNGHKGRQDGRDKAEKTESEDTTAAAKESSIDGYVYDGEPIEIHLGDINSQFPLNLAYNLGYLQEEFEGSNVTFTMDYFQNGPAISEAFASGDLDFAEFGE